MSSQATIIAAIDSLVANRNRPYETWTIGVTDSPDRRRDEHRNSGKDTQWWRHWNADTEMDARAVEQHFLNKRMQGGTGGPGRADYVYVF